MIKWKSPAGGVCEIIQLTPADNVISLSLYPHAKGALLVHLQDRVSRCCLGHAGDHCVTLGQETHTLERTKQVNRLCTLSGRPFISKKSNQKN